jgi:hypothetical protein
MSFLDNLENTLKALERQEERDPEKQRRDREQREAERDAAIQRGPFVEALRDSAFTSELLGQCRLVGRELRVLVQFTWIGETLRLDAREKRMELMPTSEGIVAVTYEDTVEKTQASVNLDKDDPAALVRQWLK